MSTKKTIYIIRHGQTDYNKEGIIQGGGIDSDINALGVKQAELFYQHYRHIGFDQIYASSLKRTIQSLQPFVEAGRKPEILTELDEINWGFFEGLRTDAETKTVYESIIKDWSNGMLDRSVAGGESPNALFQRQQRGLQKILARKHEETILICMHGRAMRSFLCLLTNTPLHRMDEFPHSNLCLYRLIENGRGFDIVERNNRAHLTTID